MALPSQTAQPARRRIYMSRRRRRLRPAVPVVGCLALVIAAVWVLRPNGDPDPAGSEPASGSRSDTGLTDPAPPLAAARQVVRPAAAPIQKAVSTGKKPRRPQHRDEAPAKPLEKAPDATSEQVPVTLVGGQLLREADPPVLAVPEPTPTRSAMSDQVQAGLRHAQHNQPLRARTLLTAALRSDRLNPVDADFVRETLQSLNRRLVFSPEVVAGDPFARSHTVAPGERLGGIVRDASLDVDWRFILRINHMLSERHLRPGQRLKLITGPFHVVVDKSDFRMDVYLGSDDRIVYVTSLPVGTGEYDATPVGLFRVKPGSRVENPSWANPRTGERFDRDDPSNPIGEHWIGLEGLDDATRNMVGYGIHGTIEINSIGRQASMGCIRMRPDDVALIYEMLSEKSTVEIRP